MQLLLEEGADPENTEEDLLSWAEKDGHDSIWLILQERADLKFKRRPLVRFLSYAAGIGKKLWVGIEDPEDSEN